MALITPPYSSALNSSPLAWCQRREEEKGEEGRGGGGITLPNVCRPQLGALSRSQRVAGWKSARGDSQAPASPPLSSVHLSPSPSNNPPGGTSLPPSTFFLPPLPSGGAGEVVWKGTPGLAGSGEYRCQILRQRCSFDFRAIKEEEEEKNVGALQIDIY